jgi:hypothetical protein
MIKTRICSKCGHLLAEAANALREHDRDIRLGLRLNVKGELTEELRRQIAPDFVVSFNGARRAWDAYCRHLDRHGLLKPALQGKVPE